MATTLTITPENFGKKISTIYDRVKITGRIRVKIEDVEEKELPLAEYLKSEEYRNDQWTVCTSVEELFLHLKAIK